ncbi:tRNA pseudouridine(38-40) synthase TruA [Kriegella aquimaris]|uniref:tRNA pseudouridine synthase A n=1 Tax=Kriegella aquimaris TaxID=192904 RepID=A0A1G9IVZ1_9FLAO|nr:tRNA pseudouridine(38-40) synthase TruA [Kriegella aquimaris]SDL28984.1 tRNA pseudouridine38-40 synthase [Kriegella aquimaris]
MKRNKYYYLIQLQYLGFRYSGWQKQPQQRTVEGMITKTLKFVLEGQKFKILGAGRTDAKVSAINTAFELFLEETPIEDHQKFLEVFNMNLPPDIKALEIKEVDTLFNIIQNAKTKEYVYLFSFGSKHHPFCAPFMANFHENLDVEIMKEGAQLFVGTHNFSAYTARLRENTDVMRTIESCKIKPNTLLTANFFPETSYALYVTGKGFMRYQIRMIMGALVQLGRNELQLQDVKESLCDSNNLQLTFVAPGSGLLLNQLEFE